MRRVENSWVERDGVTALEQVFRDGLHLPERDRALLRADDVATGDRNTLRSGDLEKIGRVLDRLLDMRAAAHPVFRIGESPLKIADEDSEALAQADLSNCAEGRGGKGGIRKC